MMSFSCLRHLISGMFSYYTKGRTWRIKENSVKSLIFERSIDYVSLTKLGRVGQYGLNGSCCYPMQLEEFPWQGPLYGMFCSQSSTGIQGKTAGFQLKRINCKL